MDRLSRLLWEGAKGMKVLIFTEEKMGEGHLQAAKAIKEAFHELSQNQVSVILKSGMGLIHPLVERGAARLYLAFIRHFPKIWSILYHRIHTPFLIQNALFRYRLSRFLQKERPEVILCTHPACVRPLAQLKREESHPFKLGVIFTDFGFHPFAVAREADYFFVPHPSVKEELVQNYQIDPAKVWAFGIPVHPRFEMGQLKREGRKKEGGKGRPFHLLIMGGALGLGPLQKIVEHFASEKEKFKLTVICGRNRSLYKKLVRRAPEHVTVLGYVSNVAEVMEQADAILSKPGGLTTTEALLCGKPLFMLPPLPGQEETNRRWVEERKLGISIGALGNLAEEIYHYLDNFEKETWAKRVDQHILGAAAYRIARKVLEDHGSKWASFALFPSIAVLLNECFHVLRYML